MNTNWTIWTPIIAAFVIQVFGVLLQEILVRAREKPRRKALVQKSTQTGVAKRLLYFLFPPDWRLAFMPVNFLASLMLNLHLMSTQPITRYAVFSIAAWIGIMVLSLTMETVYIVCKYFALLQADILAGAGDAEVDPCTVPADATVATNITSFEMRRVLKRRQLRGKGTRR